MYRILTFVLFGIAVAATSFAAGPFVFISISGENRIAVYQLDEAGGQLTLLDNISLTGRPGPLAIHPNRKFLYASIRSVGNLASFRIDAETGKLQLINEVAAGADPAYVAVDPSGRFLLSAYYRAGKVTVHAIDPSGRIGDLLQSVDTDEKAHAIVSDRSGRFWFVPHTGPNAIFQFQFDSSRGQLTPNQPPKLLRQPNTGPRHLWFHPDGDVAYTSDEQGRSVSAYRFDRQAGTLELTQTLSTLPPEADRSQGGSTSDIEVHPSGNFVYVANRGHDSIARFGVDEKTYTLLYRGNTATEQTTRSFNIAPSGRFLIAAGQKSGKAIVFAIDAETGDLDPTQTIEVGDAPWWVQIR